MIISDEDRRWLKKNQPGLRDDSHGDKILIAGRFEFIAAHDEINSCYIQNPDECEHENLICISDSYELEIAGTAESREFPKVYEVAGRIKQLASTRGCDIKDLHIYETGEVCLVGPFDMKLDLSLPIFLDEPVLQFFYDQSYHEKYGCWPRGQYAHGVLGLFENYCDRLQDGRDNLASTCIRYLEGMNPCEKRERAIVLLNEKQRVQGHEPCICGSGREFRDCHYKAFTGIWNLQQRIHRPA